MMNLDYFKEKKIAVYGIGKTGVSVVNAFYNAGIKVLILDDDNSKLESLKNKAKIATIDEINELDYLVLSPGIALNFPYVPEIVKKARLLNAEIICDIELLYLSQKPKIIGITGTNGKSTTTSLLAHIFKELEIEFQMGGNIGVPVLELDPADLYILELSSYQLDLLKKTKFFISTILNITPDHIDRHGSFENYIDSKKKILLNSANPIVNKDDEILNKCEGFSFSLKGVADLYLDGNIIRYKEESFELPEFIYLPGEHNKQNIIAALSICAVANIDLSEAISRISSFKGLSHRLELVLEKNGIKFINDSKATNAESTSKALGAYENIHWIVGGVAKEGGIDSLKPFFDKVKHAYVIGNTPDIFEKSLNGIDYSISGSLKIALESAKKNATIGDVILLSPAAASFDQWSNFEQRGEEFCRLVKND